MGQSAQTKMKNKKRTNITATQEGNKEAKQTSKVQNGCLKTSKSESECQTVEAVNVDNNHKVKTLTKTRVVLKPEDLGIAYTENLILKQGVKREDLLHEKFGMQQLSVLVTMGDVEKTKTFFDSDAERDPNERVECDGSTPLILAADKKHVEIVKLLLEHGADCTLTNDEGNNALMTAIRSGDADVINAIWPHRSSINLNHANKHGCTALHYAADRKWECCVQFLLANGASPDCQTNNGVTPLMIAAKLGDKKTAERLVQAKADILAGDRDDSTAICKAMKHSKTDVLAYLLEKLSEEDAEVFLRAKLYYLRHQVEQSTVDDMYTYRLIMRLTRKPTLRDVFYNQKVISIVLDRMKEARQCPQDMLQLSALLCSIMFMFNKRPDVKLIKQYIYGGGPDFSTDTVRYFIDKINAMERETIVCYLPIIGITEAPEGMSWLKKNALRLSEYSTYFCERLSHHLKYAINDTLVDIDPDFLKVLTPVWKSFHRIVFDIQKKLREKTLLELLKEEEREKEKKVKKKEKKQQKRVTEKEKKTHKPSSFGPQPLAPVSVLTKPPVEGNRVKSTNVSQNSNDSEQDSAPRPDMKHRKNQRSKRINEAINENPGRLGECNDAFTKSDYIENQFVAYSSSPDSWKTVQTKKQISKEKDKITEKDRVKEKQEIVDTKKEEQSKCKKYPPKPSRKGAEKWKHQRDRTYGANACWADVAKAQENGQLQEDNISGFSYEDDFPTLTGSKRQTDLKHSKPVTKSSTQSGSASDIHDDYQKDNLTCNSDGSGNPSSHSGLSLSSFCEIEPCGPEEKYYSDEEVLGYPQQPISEEITYAGWEDMANMNDIRCNSTAYTVGQNPVKQMNSDTLQYLVDAYIAADASPELSDKFNSSESLQNVLSVSQESANNIEETMSNCDKKPEEDKYVINQTPCVQDKSDDGSRTNHFFKTVNTKKCHDEAWNSGTDLHCDQPAQIEGADIHITQTAYARDPSPTKAPRKRFVYGKDKKVFHDKHDRQAEENATKGRSDRQIPKENSCTFKLDVNDVQALRGQVYEPIMPKHDKYPSNGCFMDMKETDQITFGWDDEENAEPLPTWFTNTEPSNTSYNMYDLNERKAANYYEDQVFTEERYDKQPNNVPPSIPPTYGKTYSTPDDDISIDPCVVQYWTQPGESNARQEFSNQAEIHCNTSVSTPQTCKSADASFSTGFNKGNENITKDVQGMKPMEATNDATTNSCGTSKRKTAVVKPQQWQHARHSVNCALGQSILENACRIDTTPDEILYPSDLRGSPVPEQMEPAYFPSFHEETMLSADYHPDAISVFHKIQQMQLAQLKNYYDAFRGHLLEKMSVYQSDFHYHASCTGLTEQEICDHIGCAPQQQQQQHQQQQRQQQQHIGENLPTYEEATQADIINQRRDTRPVLNQAARLEYKNQRDTAVHSNNGRTVPYEQYGSGYQTDIEIAQRPGSPRPRQNVRQSALTNHAAVNLEQDIPVSKVDTDVTADELKVIAAREVADKALEDIKAAYNAMVAHAIKSQRWRDKLLDIRHMAAADINMIENIVFPKVNQARYVIASRPDTVMLGFLLNGTPVAVRIVSWKSRHLIRDDLQRLVDLDVSKYFMSKYKAFSFLNGNYYIAMDLYEYNLEEYLYKLKTDGQDSPLCTNKLIWQFLRGLNSIHQHCLMVHGEIRPSNIVLDVSGNLRITGYGLGRKINSDETSSEISADEKCWTAPEILHQDQGDSFKADIWSAGMIMYFILSGGKLPFGANPHDVVWNLSRRNLRMENINEEAFHLLSTMMSLNKAERPATSEALRHPYFWAEEKRLRFVLIAGSDVLRDLKMGIPMTGGPGDSMIDILNSVPSSSLADWMTEIDQAVLKEMRTFRQYKNSVVELVLFVYNCCLHFEKMSSKTREIIDEPCRYFLTRFPTLFMTVYGAIKMSNRTEKTCYKPFF